MRTIDTTKPSRQLDIAIAKELGWTDNLVSNFPTQLSPPGKSDIVTTIPCYSQPTNDGDKAALFDCLYWLSMNRAAVVNEYHFGFLIGKFSINRPDEWIETARHGEVTPTVNDLAAFALAICQAVIVVSGK